MTDSSSQHPMALSSEKSVLCIADDRAWCEPGIRILIDSLSNHSPELGIELFYPPAGDDFRLWLNQYPRVRLNHFALEGEWRGWNIKPELLMILLRAGYERVLWIDSDIVVASAVGPVLHDLAAQKLIIAEEALCASHYDGDAVRARGWGLEVGRRVPFSLNTGVVGVTLAHLALLKRWHEVLCSDEYRAAMILPWDRRPLHFITDQEALTALLCSREFADIPLHILHRGKSIIQYFGSAGYTVRERLANLLRPPVFIHSMGHKAWLPLPDTVGLSAQLLSLYQELSPYRVAARRHRASLADDRWLRPQSRLGRFMMGIGLAQTSLVGLPIALLNDAVRWVKWAGTGGEPRR